MIPYDDLVAALTSWRAKQGLPIASGVPVPGSGPTPSSGPVLTPSSGPIMSPGSGPLGMSPTPGSGPARTAPPAPPKYGGYQPPPLASPDTADDSLDVDDEALLEEAHYENEGDDFAMKFQAPESAVETDEESTTLGQAPESPNRDSFGGETDWDPKTRKPW